MNNLYKFIAIAAMTIAFATSLPAAGVNNANITTFQADTVAKASEVNANFGEHTIQINDNDARIEANITNIGTNTDDIAATNVAVNAKQNRVLETCPAGSSIRVINADGTVVCEVDTDTDTNTTYSAGAGLTLTDTTFGADTAVVQSRVTQTCPAGQSIRVINADGTVACEVDTDTDTNTTYSAGAGLTLTDTTFGADTAVVQSRVTQTCPAGQSIRVINADGTVACEVDTDTNTTYSAGSGLTLNGTTFGADTAVVQSRVTQTCPAGQSIRVINADGSVVCEVDTDTNTTYAAGAGLTLTDTTFESDATVVQSRVTQTCPAGQSIRVINADGTVTCETDTDTNTTYSAGSGLTLTDTTFESDATVVQSRVTQTCPAGQSIRVINADGTVACEVDTDTDTNTTYSAGSGLTLTDTTFESDATVVQSRVTQTCPAGQSIRVINADGTVTCETDTDTNTTYSAGSGLTLNGTTFDADTAVVQSRVTQTCPAGQSIRVINANGTVTCEVDSDSVTGVIAGDFLNGDGPTGAVTLDVVGMPGGNIATDNGLGLTSSISTISSVAIEVPTGGGFVHVTASGGYLISPTVGVPSPTMEITITSLGSGEAFSNSDNSYRIISPQGPDGSNIYGSFHTQEFNSVSAGPITYILQARSATTSASIVNISIVAMFVPQQL